MFKPYIVSKAGEYAICRKWFGITQYNERSLRFCWSFLDSNAFTYSSYSSAETSLKKLMNPPKWEPAKPPITINAPTV